MNRLYKLSQSSALRCSAIHTHDALPTSHYSRNLELRRGVVGVMCNSAASLVGLGRETRVMHHHQQI
jgi:hypothetical protein